MIKKGIVLLVLISAMLAACSDDTGGTTGTSGGIQTSETNTVYFLKPADWGTPSIYVFEPYFAGPFGMTTLSGADTGWYSYTATNSGALKVAFYDTSSPGSYKYMTRSGTGWFTPWILVWSNTPPPDAPASTGSFTIHINKPSTWATFDINFETEGGNVTDAGNGWYSCTSSSGLPGNYFWFSDSSGIVTDSFTRTTEGWLNLIQDGGWTDSKP